jgi:hypothetical protein
MDAGETTEIRRTRRLRRVALTALITLAILWSSQWASTLLRS